MKVRLLGGLGNQMFGYAFGRSLSLSRNIPLYFDKWLVDIDPQRCYSLGAYDLDICFDGPGGPDYSEQCVPYDVGVLSAPENSVFTGYWQSTKYMNVDIVRKEFAKPSGDPSDETKRVADSMNDANNSAFVSVRRRDYITLGASLPLEYYVSGMNYIRERHSGTRFFVFSDDREWCQENITGPDSTIVAHSQLDSHYTRGTIHWDLWLMNLCKCAVVSASSFSWWGAWINPDKKLVIAPKTWFANISPLESWVRL